jgi:hypothetical protein
MMSLRGAGISRRSGVSLLGTRAQRIAPRYSRFTGGQGQGCPSIYRLIRPGSPPAVQWPRDAQSRFPGPRVAFRDAAITGPKVSAGRWTTICSTASRPRSGALGVGIDGAGAVRLALPGCEVLCGSRRCVCESAMTISPLGHLSMGARVRACPTSEALRRGWLAPRSGTKVTLLAPHRQFPVSTRST